MYINYDPVLNCYISLTASLKGFSPSDNLMKISVLLPVALLSILAAASSAPSQGKGKARGFTFLFLYNYTDERGDRGNEQRSNALIQVLETITQVQEGT